MKKLLITSFAVAAMAIGGGVFAHTALIGGDPILEANVEALTNGESESTKWYVNQNDDYVICTPWGDEDC